ncbi:kinase-like domain-containing protein [Xylariales sp. PMI_506]|nr:kinase-like domain-containing protein [Xylariales sp. PMI_506]
MEETVFEVHSSDQRFIHHPHHAQFLCTEIGPFQLAPSMSDSYFSVEDDDKGTPAPQIVAPKFLRITVNDTPSNPARGFIAGRNEAACDILLFTDLQLPCISKKQFSIFPNESGTLMFRNLSRNGTYVKLPDREPLVVKALLALPSTGDVEIYLGATPIRLRIPSHENQANWQRLWLQYCKTQAQSVPLLTDLEIASSTTSHSTFLRDFRIGQRLGSGQSGNVYRATHVTKGNVLAVKEYFKPTESNLREAQLLVKLSHQNIVKTYAYIFEPGKRLIAIMDLIGEENLRDHIRNHPLSDRETRRVSHQSLHGLAYIHDQHIIHRDIKPENILIYQLEPISIKLADFGSATNAIINKSLAGSWKYIAPEIVYEETYDFKADVWSLGVMIMEVSNCKSLEWAAHTPQAWIKAILHHVQSFAHVHSLDHLAVGQFVASLLLDNPINRPSAIECLGHRFFTEKLTEDCLSPSISSLSTEPCGAPTKASHHNSTRSRSLRACNRSHSSEPVSNKLACPNNLAEQQLPEEPLIEKCPTDDNLLKEHIVGNARLSKTKLPKRIRPDTKLPQGFINLEDLQCTKLVAYNSLTGTINMTHLLRRYFKLPKGRTALILKKYGSDRSEIIRGPCYQGSYFTVEVMHHILAKESLTLPRVPLLSDIY